MSAEIKKHKRETVGGLALRKIGFQRVATCLLADTIRSRFRLMILSFGDTIFAMPVPTAQEWIDRVARPPMPAMERIETLIEKYNTIHAERIPEEGSRAAGQRRGAVSDLFVKELFVLFQIERASRFVKKYAMQRADEKLGGALNAKQIKAVEELHGIVYSEVKDSMGATDDADYEKKIIQRFGKNVVEKEKKKDAALRDKDMLVEFLTPQEQKELKLSFRNGLAHKWTFDAQKKKGKIEKYDTKSFDDAHRSEYEASLYVMDRKGGIHVYGQETEKMLKHSSLLAGAGALCAGTIRIEDGKVKWLTGRSGHYQPTVDNLVSVLERLRQYQVDLKGVIVFRENYTKTFKNAPDQPGKNYEPCQALELLKKRAWPGEEPNSMKVG